ncbi:MAG: hypothetical protein HY557_04220 [Euryarchaeota archaeon]|nr:hypothetical protein [Euryarchaeota archaeon]
MKAQPKIADANRQVAQVGRDAVAFFRRAKSLAADPRVKFIFDRATEVYERAVKLLESLPGARGKAKAPDIFPFSEYERIECYVCGFEAKGDEPPESCPSCGAARYAFERDVSQDKAWDVVAKGTRDALALTRKLAASADKPAQRDLLAKVIEIQKALLEEAKEERARIRAAA